MTIFRSMNRILRWTKGYHRRLYLGSLCSFLATWAAAGPVMLAAWALGLVIESAQEGTALDARLPWLCLGGIVVLILLRFFFTYWKNRLQESIGTERAAEQRMELGNVLKRVSLGYFAKNDLGDILAALTTELSTLELQSMKMVDAVVNGYIQVAVILLCVAFFCPPAALAALIGVLVSYAVALVTGAVDFQRISEAAWIGIPLHKEAMGLFAIDGSPEFISALFTIIPIALATMMEHVGDIAAISATVGHNYINDPGLNRTLLGDGLATTMAGLLGGPANTTYGENTGVLALSKIYDPLVIRIAAVLAIILSFSPKFEAVINTIPTGIIGGISFVLYGMISAIGVRNVVENRVDFTNSRNLIVAAVILVCALGFNSVGGVSFAVAGVTINLSGLAVAAIAGILLNAILPGNDYEFDAADGSEAATSSNLQV